MFLRVIKCLWNFSEGGGWQKWHIKSGLVWVCSLYWRSITCLFSSELLHVIQECLWNMILVPHRPQQLGNSRFFVGFSTKIVTKWLRNWNLPWWFSDISKTFGTLFFATPQFSNLIHAGGLIHPHSSEVIHITTKWVWWFLVAKAIYSCRQCAAHRHWCFF